MNQEQLLAKLSSFASYEKGWDSYDAEPPSAMAITRMRAVLETAYNLGITESLFLCLSVEGGVCVCVGNECGEYGEIECFNGGEIMAISSGMDDREVWDVPFTDQALSDALKRLCDDCGLDRGA